METKIRRMFFEFTDGINGKFIDNIFYGDNKLERSRKNKATISRGNIKFLEENILKIIKQASQKETKTNVNEN